ncbi:Outer membrane protein beta-barrel domain-containing protein [Zobellia uliginosa]|uniref:Outer membrane protein beta-barrel domain-containing protein n=1 Tax=Zobellia uliginosa TaxID=143224 RepID=A0ABY1KWA6_9FLAO|nr:outer membrane beta-barrel protein [Zobellia uliginosa]SIS85976.1 Outer membrane protein beta-barrel domain-containing protein [Zobellia uliginosa]
MKQKILLIFMIGFLTQIYSQDKKTEIQLSLGPTFSIPKTSELANTNVDGSPEIKSSVHIGAYILPSVNYSLNEKSSLDFGIGFYLDRFSIENKIGPVTNKGNRSISQIQTPINFNFHFGQDNSYQLGIGGFASFLLSAKEKGDTITDFSQLDIFNPNDPNFNNNATISYDNNLKDNYNSVGVGAFVQLKKSISFSTDKKGFILLRINQYFNSIKNNDADSNQFIEFKNEKEPTTINLGIGIIL